jgi:hypothetical protein
MLSLLLAIALAGADPDSAEETTRRDEVAKLAAAKARQIEMVVGSSEHAAKLQAEPLLRWSNPTAGSVHGEVYLWSHQGRPAAIASIYRWYHPFKDSTLEVVTTTPLSVAAREDKELLWEAEAGGIEFKPLAEAPSPAKTATARLNQMRQLARRFSARLDDKRDGEVVQRELRLLNQPVHRYKSDEQHIVDGALFTLVEVTDPEIWILLEAVEKEGKKRWQYALARMNADACAVRLDDKPLQRWEKIVDPWKIRKAPYTLLGFKPETVRIESEEKE